MILALLGLPILFIYLTVVGSSLAAAFRRLYSFVCCCCCSRGRRREGSRPSSASNNSTLEKSGASNSSEQPFSKASWPPPGGQHTHLTLCHDCSSARRRTDFRLVEESVVQVRLFVFDIIVVKRMKKIKLVRMPKLIIQFLAGVIVN